LTFIQAKKCSLQETLALIQAKRVDFDSYGPYKNAMCANANDYCTNLLKAIVTLLWSKGVHCNLQQIQDKWDQLALDFKKVHDYEKKIPFGKPNYFAMSP